MLALIVAATTIRALNQSRNLVVQSLKNQFLANIRNDLLSGNYAVVYKRCSSFVQDGVFKGIQIEDMSKQIICPYRPENENIHQSPIREKIYFDDNNTTAAANINFYESRFIDPSFYLFIGLATLAVVLLSYFLFTFAIRKVALIISQPLTALGDRLNSPQIRAALKSINATLEFELPYTEFENLAASFKRIEQQLDKYENEVLSHTQQKAYSDIARQVAHDIRSPLTALKSLVRHGVDTPDKSSLLLSVTQRIEAITDDLLKAYKGRSEDTNKTSVEKLIHSLVIQKQLELKELNKPIVIKTSLNEQVQLDLDSNLLLRVLSNLINNSIEANANNIEIKLFQNSNFIHLELYDDGKGMSEADLELILNTPQSLNKNHGNGLGLQHAIQTIEIWNGSLKIKSKVGLGTTVEIVLPNKKL